METTHLALDRGSARQIDKDGRLHVELTPISKSNICGYRGLEIPNFDALGLDPDSIYHLFRDPSELKKAESTFNNLPVLSRHVAVTAADPRPDLVIGSTGTDAKFDAPYLRCSLVFWSDKWIDRIESDDQRELSSAYRYEADMTPGTHEGIHYDGVMRNISGSHVALVPQGRAGPDVMVADSMPLELQLHLGEQDMPIATTATSRKALMAHGALIQYLKPKLAQDTQIDLKKALLGTTAKNWPQAKPMIAQRLKDATRGRLAKDATLEDIHSMLDSLDREGEGEDDAMEGGEDKAAADMKAKDAKRAKDEGISEEEAKKKREAEDARTARDSRRASDESEETEEERDARLKKRGEDKKAKDGESEEEKKKREETEARDKKARDSEPKPVTKAAMDAALEQQAVELQAKWQKSQRDLTEALEIVKPVVGTLMAQDSAEAVYRLLFTSESVDIADVPPAAFKALAQQTMRAAIAKPAQKMASDGAAPKGFAERFPDAMRIRAA